MRFMLVSTEDSSKIPVDIPAEIVTKPPKNVRTGEKTVRKRTPPKNGRTGEKTVRKRTPSKKVRRNINKSKSTQRSKSIIPKHGSVHHRN